MEVKGHEQGWLYKVKLYKAHITCANEVFNVGLDTDFLQDLQFTNAKSICVGDLAATMEELHAEIEDEAGAPDFGEWAQTVAALNSQRLDLIDESEKLNEDMERRWEQDSTKFRRIALSYCLYIYAKSALAAIQEVQHDFLFGEYEPANVGIAEGVIAHMMCYAYGSDEAIEEYDASEFPAIVDRAAMRAEISACIDQIFKILDTIHRVK